MRRVRPHHVGPPHPPPGLHPGPHQDPYDAPPGLNRQVRSPTNRGAPTGFRHSRFGPPVASSGPPPPGYMHVPQVPPHHHVHTYTPRAHPAANMYAPRAPQQVHMYAPRAPHQVSMYAPGSRFPTHMHAPGPRSPTHMHAPGSRFPTHIHAPGQFPQQQPVHIPQRVPVPPQVHMHATGQSIAPVPINPGIPPGANFQSPPNGQFQNTAVILTRELNLQKAPYFNIKGTVVKITEKGFGFIRTDEFNTDIFFHDDELYGSIDIAQLRLGDEVLFDIWPSEKNESKPESRNVRPLSNEVQFRARDVSVERQEQEYREKDHWDTNSFAPRNRRRRRRRRDKEPSESRSRSRERSNSVR